MRSFRLLALSSLLLAACAPPSDNADSSEGAQTEERALDAFDYDTWQWKSGKPGCGLSRIGKNVESAVLGAGHNLDIMPKGKDDARWHATTRNVAGPAF